MLGSQERSGRAVVVGAGMAGLLAARVLSDHFQQVVVLEQDELPEGPTPRAGVPQGGHAHNLLARGCQILEELFPGVVAELESYGALGFDYGAQTYLHLHGRPLARCTLGVRTVSCSRDLLEWCVRRRLRSRPGVEVRSSTRVERLLPGAPGQVRGVGVRRLAEDERVSEQALEADLVVDASGRGSHAAEWLAALGLERPPESVVDPGLSYCTRWYRVPEARLTEKLGDWVLIALSTEFPHSPRSGSISRVEGERMLVTLVGTGHYYPPDDDAGFVEFTRHLPHSAIYELLREAEPVSPIYSFRGTLYRRYHFEQVGRWPEGFVVLGDAACAFNPVYGQGMTMAALSAQLLGERLERQRRKGRLGADFQQRLARMQEGLWFMAAGEDLRWESPAQPQSTAQRMSYWAQQQLLRSLGATEEGAKRFLEIMHLLRSPLTLLEPASVAQVAKGTARRLQAAVFSSIPFQS